MKGADRAVCSQPLLHKHLCDESSVGSETCMHIAYLVLVVAFGTWVEAFSTRFRSSSNAGCTFVPCIASGNKHRACERYESLLRVEDLGPT